MIDDNFVLAHRQRALNPDNPFIRGTAQNPDVFFQARETVNPFYAATPASSNRRWNGSRNSPAGDTGCSTIGAIPRPSGCLS